jgi:acyl carrier protein
MAGGGTGEGRKRGELDALSVEAQVAALWERVLGVPDIAPEASFFDVGGDSLKGVQLVAQLNEHFGLAIPVGQFFGAPTIASLAALIRDTGHAGTSTAADPALEASRERGRLRGARRGRREPA